MQGRQLSEFLEAVGQHVVDCRLLSKNASLMWMDELLHRREPGTMIPPQISRILLVSSLISSGGKFSSIRRDLSHPPWCMGHTLGWLLGRADSETWDTPGGLGKGQSLPVCWRHPRFGGERTSKRNPSIFKARCVSIIFSEAAFFLQTGTPQCSPSIRSAPARLSEMRERIRPDVARGGSRPTEDGARDRSKKEGYAVLENGT